MIEEQAWSEVIIDSATKEKARQDIEEFLSRPYSGLLADQNLGLWYLKIAEAINDQDLLFKLAKHTGRNRLAAKIKKGL